MESSLTLAARSLDTNLDRPFPQNPDAERDLLGAILVTNSYLSDAIAEGLKPEHFADPARGRVFAEMIGMVEDGEEITEVVLADRMRASGPDSVHLDDLTVGVPKVVSNVKQLARIIIDKATLRAVIHSAHRLADEAFTKQDASAAVVHLNLEAARLATLALPQDDSFQIYTAPELAALSPPHVDYIAWQIAARGMVAEIDGAPKTSGKTTLILTAIAASFRRQLFLNRATKRVPVLYVTEENPRTFRLALERAGLTHEPDLHIIPYVSLAGLSWPQIAQRIEKLCVDLEIGWLVLDTFCKIAGIPGDDENKPGVMTEALAPVQRIAGRLDVAVSLGRHERKSGGDVGTSGRGSSAFTGDVDIVMQLRRIAGNHLRRQLEVAGRHDDGGKITIELRDCKYVIAEDKVIDGADEANRLRDAIAGEPKISDREIERKTGIGRMRVPKIAKQLGLIRGGSGWERVEK